MAPRRSTRLSLLLWWLLLTVGASCGGGGGGSRPSLDLVAITDVNPDPDVVEVELVAASGQIRYLSDGVADVWGYRDGAVPDSAVAIPGPLIQAKQGDSIVVHFKNDLPEATTVHWHGLRVPNASDGTPSTQIEVPPGGTFEYTFRAEDAGTFWYHPHLRGDAQIERGLYGALVVTGGPEIPVHAERTFVLDDVKLEATGRLSEQTDALDLMLGRQGNIVLVNGHTGGTIEAQASARERWRFVNTANGRYFNLRLPGRAFTVIGWDGGLLPQPYAAETLLITPGERYEVLVDLSGSPGETLALETVHYDRGHDIPDPGPKVVFEVVLGGAAPAVSPLPTVWGPTPDLVVDPSTPVRHVVLGEQEPMNPGDEPRFFVGGVSFPDVPPIVGSTGDVDIWSVDNETEMDHPFHLHGMFFQVLDVGGVAPAHLGWKDTANVPRNQSLRFAVRYQGAGTWMYHCHILEHAERGMMGTLVLSPGT